jgi:hypothetical protein
MASSQQDYKFLFNLLNDFDFIFLKYIDRAESIDESNFSYFIISLMNRIFLKDYLVLEGYSKFIISLMYLKKRFFK